VKVCFFDHYDEFLFNYFFQYATVLEVRVNVAEKKGFESCLQVFHQFCRRQQLNVHAALMTTLLSKANTKPLLLRIKSRLEIIELFWANLCSVWRLLSPFWEELSPVLGLKSP